MSTLPPLEKFLRTPMLITCQISQNKNSFNSFLYGNICSQHRNCQNFFQTKHLQQHFKDNVANLQICIFNGKINFTYNQRVTKNLLQEFFTFLEENCNLLIKLSHNSQNHQLEVPKLSLNVFRHRQDDAKFQKDGLRFLVVLLKFNLWQ